MTNIAEMFDAALMRSAVIVPDPSEDLGKKIDLTPMQRSRAEQIMIANSRLRDHRGLLILNDLDQWLVVQLAKMLFNDDGTARAIHETASVEFNW